MVDSTTPKLSIKLQGDLQRNPDVTIGAYKPKPVAALPVPKPDDADLGTPVNPNVSTPVLDIQPDSGVTKMQSFGAGFAPVGRDLYQAISEKMHFEPEEGYDPQADYDEFVQTYSITNPEEIKSLLTATSKGAFDNRALRIQEKRDRDVKINANPWSAVAGSVLDIDIPVALASGGAGGAVKAGIATQRVVSAGIAGATIGTAMGVAGDAQMTSDAERIGVVAAGVLGGATALVRPRKPSTTPLTPTSPNSTVSTAAILPEEAVVSQSIPKPVLPDGTVISPLPTSGSGVLKQTQLSQAQLLDDLVEVEIQSISAPTPSTVVSIPAGSAKINLSSPLQGDGTELKLPKLAVEHHAVAALQSAADEMFYYTKGDPEEAMNRILASPYTQGDDAVTHANAVLRDMEVKLVPFEESIVKATKELHGTTSVFGKLFRKDHNKRLQQTSMDVYSELQKIDQVVVEAAGTGKTLSNAEIHALIDATSNPDAIKASMKTYVDSNIAGEMYDHIKRVGLMDDDALEHIVRRPTYVTTKHSYEAQKRFIDADTVNTAGRRLAVANFFGEQITKMYPDLMRGIKGTDGKIINLKTDAIGAKFMDNMKVRSENPNAVRTIGVSKDELYDMLTSQGLDDAAAKALSVKLTQTRSAQHGEKHLRRRIDWDWTKTATAPDGTVFGMRDLVDQNAYHTIVDYNRRMSKRVGLAQYGFKDAQSLQDAKSRIMDNLPEGTNPNKARQYLDNVINGALGNPIGADMPDWVRSMNTIGGSILLSGSGLYNAIELGVQVQRLGLLRSIPHFAAALKPMVKTVGSYSKAEAKTLHDTLVGKMMSTDRWQNIMTHYADDFTIEGGFHESVQYFGQATRFLNGSEYIKRYQIGLFASVFVDAFKGAAKGSPNSIKFLKDGLRFSDELLEKTTQQFNKHGDNIDGWDADIRIAMEQKVFHEGDNLAHVVHNGEVPSFMEYSQVGKIIFPFMRYLFAMQQKILRRTHLRDGTTGVALVLAVQFPLAVMVAHTKRAMNGDKPYDMDNPEDVKMFIRSTLNGMSGLGSMTYPIDIMMSGGQNMGSTIALAPIGKMVGLTEGILTGEATARDFKEATPFNTILPVNLLLAALNDED